jgi:hypothetical protein
VISQAFTRDGQGIVVQRDLDLFLLKTRKLYDHRESGQTLQTTLSSNPALGWALITHPFHPLKGRRFAILKIRKAAGREVLSLYDEQRGSLPIPRDWTDQAVPSANAGLIEPAPILDARCLLKLHDLVQTLTKRVDDE